MFSMGSRNSAPTGHDHASPGSSGGAISRLVDSLSSGLSSLHLPSMRDLRGLLGSGGSQPEAETSNPSNSQNPSMLDQPAARESRSETDHHVTFEDMHSHADIHSRASALAAGNKGLTREQIDEAIELLPQITDPRLALALESRVEDTEQRIDYQQRNAQEDQLMDRENREEISVLAQFRQRFMQALGKLINRAAPVPTPEAEVVPGVDVA